MIADEETGGVKNDEVEQESAGAISLKTDAVKEEEAHSSQGNGVNAEQMKDVNAANKDVEVPVSEAGGMRSDGVKAES